MKMRALDNCRRLCRPRAVPARQAVGAIVGPYRIDSVAVPRRSSVTTNKTAQEAVRGFGQVADQLRHRDRDRPRRGASGPRPARGSAAQPHPHRAVPLPDPERHHLRQRRLSHRGRQGARASPIIAALMAERDRLRAERAAGRHRHRDLPRAERRQLAFEPLLNPSNEPRRPGWIPAASRSIALGAITALIAHLGSGQGHETLAATVVGEVLGSIPTASA